MDASAFNHLPPPAWQAIGCLGVIALAIGAAIAVVAFECGRSYERDFGKEVQHVAPR